MKRYLLATVCFLLAGALLTLPGFLRQQPEGQRPFHWYEKMFWFLVQDRRPNFEDCDEAWQTSMKLSNIQNSFGHFNQLADKSDREAIRKVQTIDELWALFHKKYSGGQPLAPSPKEENYLEYTKDGWNQTFILEIKLNVNSTVIRILSKAPAYQRWVEMNVDEKGGSTRRSDPFWGRSGVAK